MCPDEELLSSFVDGEVPSPWKERLELHLAGCQDCADRVQSFGELKAAFAGSVDRAEDLALEAAAARIRASVEFGIAGLGRTRPGALAVFGRAWTRKVSLSVPFLAAGAAALVLAGLALGLFRPAQGGGAMASASRTIQPQQVSLESMAQYLKQTSLQPVMIDVPSESTFSQYGNPVIVSFVEPAVQKVPASSEADK